MSELNEMQITWAGFAGDWQEMSMYVTLSKKNYTLMKAMTFLAGPTEAEQPSFGNL